MTPVFCCGFECGQLGSLGRHWNISGSVAISTTTVRTGSRSLRVNPTATTSNAFTTLTSVNTYVIRCYVYFSTLPSADTDILSTSQGGGVSFKSSDSSIYANSSNSLGASGVAVTTGQWYLLDVSVNASADPWLVDVKVNGVPCGQATRSLSAVNGTQVFLGNIGTAATFDIFYDDVVISNTAADYPIGAGYVNHFIPTADGTHNIAGAGDFQRTLTGTDILNATTTAYQLIDDVPLESGASVDWINLVAPPNATDYVECVFGAAPGVSTPIVAPRAVEVIAGIHQAGTGTGNMEIRLNDNGTNNVIYTATTVAGVTSVNYKRKHYATPPTGGAWTVAAGAGNFNNLRVRFGSPAAVDANPDQYLDCIMIEAEFAAPVVASIPNKRLVFTQAINRSNYY